MQPTSSLREPVTRCCCATAESDVCHASIAIGVATRKMRARAANNRAGTYVMRYRCTLAIVVTSTYMSSDDILAFAAASSYAIR